MDFCYFRACAEAYTACFSLDLDRLKRSLFGSIVVIPILRKCILPPGSLLIFSFYTLKKYCNNFQTVFGGVYPNKVQAPPTLAPHWLASWAPRIKPGSPPLSALRAAVSLGFKIRPSLSHCSCLTKPCLLQIVSFKF